MVICLEQGADLHMAQLMPLPLTVSCFSKIQIGFAFLVPAHLGSPGQRAVKQVCACVCINVFVEELQSSVTVCNEIVSVNSCSLLQSVVVLLFIFSSSGLGCPGERTSAGCFVCCRTYETIGFTNFHTYR